MEYSALIFDDCMDETDSYENLEASVQVFQKDDRCRQIVVSCSTDWLLKLAQRPSPKMMMVQVADTPYIALLNGLKAVSMENVLVNGLSNVPTNEDIQKILSSLSQYPAIYMNKDLQAFDTRLLMFSLQVAIEQNLAIDTYAQAVEALGETPLQHIKG